MFSKTLFFLFLMWNISLFCQKNEGIVKDQNNRPIFAANVYLKNKLNVGSTTDFNGKVDLSTYILKHNTDTLVISSVGFEVLLVDISRLSKNKINEFILKPLNINLNEVVLTYKDPISIQFSVNKLSSLDVYLNPLANGDPLKAIALLPSSTNINENSNPVLRGSSANRSSVILNGVPIINPIKNSQVNSVGNFSLFNTEIIDKQYIYASNPPLTYGGASAGLIEIETTL